MPAIGETSPGAPAGGDGDLEGLAEGGHEGEPAGVVLLGDLAVPGPAHAPCRGLAHRAGMSFDGGRDGLRDLVIHPRSLAQPSVRTGWLCEGLCEWRPAAEQLPGSG